MIIPRAEIAAALSTVVGVRGHAYRPPTMRPGDAWPLLASLEHADGMAFYVNWRVLVCLAPAQDEKTSSDWIDSHVEALIAALSAVGYVDRVTPVVIGTEGGDRFAVQIDMRGE